MFIEQHTALGASNPNGSLPGEPPWLIGSVTDWGEHTLARIPLRLAAGRVREYPMFETAKSQFALNMQHASESHPPLNRLMRGKGELAFLALVLVLHHEYNLAAPESGVTYSRVHELFGLMNVGSPSLVKALIGLTRIRGMLQIEAAGGRTNRLIPTSALLKTLQIWFNASLDALELLAPLPESAEHLAVISELLYLCYRFVVNAYRCNGFILSEDFPAVHTFVKCRNGYIGVDGNHRQPANRRQWQAFRVGAVRRNGKKIGGVARYGAQPDECRAATRLDR
jgi:hypothetical protein